MPSVTAAVTSWLTPIAESVSGHTRRGTNHLLREVHVSLPLGGADMFAPPLIFILLIRPLNE
jgi:hypothetical protein